VFHPDFEFRDLRRRRDVWRLRLWQIKAVVVCVLVVLFMACSAIYIVRQSLIAGRPPAWPTIWPR
jgi:hypothetical protein